MCSGLAHCVFAETIAKCVNLKQGVDQEVHMAILTQGPRLCVVVIRYLNKGITSPDASFGHWLIKSSLPFTS